jgi:hypothetical protein
MTEFTNRLGELKVDVAVVDPTYLALGDVDAKDRVLHVSPLKCVLSLDVERIRALSAHL